MSGRLDLTFSYQGGRDVGRLPVVVDVVGASLEPAVKPRLVQLAKGWRQDLEPGTYLVRVRFPSGEEIRQTCTVRDGDHIPISVDVGGLAGRESLERSVVPRPVEDGEITPWNKWAGTSFSAPQIAHAVWVRRWRGEASREWKQIDFDGITASRDDNAVRYRFASGQQSNVLQLGGRSIAWRFVTLPAAPVVDVTVSPRGENDLAVEVTTDSAEAEALLGYLRTGAVEGADVTAESLLRQKRRDPIAAAIGGLGTEPFAMVPMAARRCRNQRLAAHSLRAEAPRRPGSALRRSTPTANSGGPARRAHLHGRPAAAC
jgi:hypothetical protein